MPEPVEPTDDLIQVSTLGWIELQRTRDLLFDVYHTESATRQRPFGWPDQPSESILTLYAIMYATFAQLLAAQAADSTGATTDSVTAALAEQASTLAQQMFENTSYGASFGR